MAADPDEWRAALVLLGGTGVALIMALRTICGLFRAREQETGRRMTDAEIECVLAAASALPGLVARLSAVERTLPTIADALDDLVFLSRQRPATDD
jgi:hypothetical protein